MEPTIKSMKNKENNYLIQSTHAIIKKKHACIIWPLDNNNVAKKRLAHPK